MSETEVKPITELKTPAKDEISFMANGKKYLIEAKMSIARKIMSDKIVAELMKGGTLGEIFNDWKSVYDLANSQKFADIVVLAYNRMEGIKKYQEESRYDQVLYLCALYINEENEDRRFLSLEQIKAKIADWEAEGIEYAFFLSLVKTLLSGLQKSSPDISPSTSEEMPEEKAS